MKLKNKIFISVLLIITLIGVAVGIYFFTNKEKKYENVRIISEDPSCGTPSRIIYNNKEYEISKEDAISSIKCYNEKIYYYKSIGEIDICSYIQAVNEIENTKSIFYEFGEIMLNEENLTYSMKVEKQISYAEYENGDKSRIEYRVENSNGEYGLEIFELIETIEDITILKKYSGIEYSLEFTKKDENNNVIWNYNTESGIEAQYDLVGTLEITDDRIYINENGTIVVLDRENGKTIWKSDACKETEGAFDSVYFDKNQNLYIYRGGVTVIDKNGKTKSKIDHEILSGDGVLFYPVNENELLLSGMNGYVVVGLEDYSIKYAITVSEEVEEGDFRTYTYTNKDENDNVIWTYKTKGCYFTELEMIEFLTIIRNTIYINEGGTITALNIDTGKVIWQNSDYNGASSVFCVDNDNNLYIAGYYGPFLCIIDENGKTVKRIDSFGIEYYWPFEIRLLEENKLVISCMKDIPERAEPEGVNLFINLKDYSVKQENIEE